MKKLILCLWGIVLSLSIHSQNTDLTQGLSIWFDKPNQLTGMASWYNYSADKEWAQGCAGSTAQR